MTSLPAILEQLAQGPLLLWVGLCDLRPRFLPKGTIGRGHRAIARNGRVLLASDRPVTELAGCTVRMRVQTWHKVILPGDPPEPYGVLLCVRRTAEEAAYEARLVRQLEAHSDLALDVGGGQWLEIRRITE